MKPRDILTAPPVPENEPAYMDPKANPKLMTIENRAEVLEHRLVETLMDVMTNGKDNNRRWATDQTAELLGKKQKSQVLITDNLNVQNNHFLEHFQRQALPAPIGDPNAQTKDMPAPLSEDEMDAYDADYTDSGDVEI